MQSTTIYLAAFDDDDLKNIRALAQTHGVAFCTMCTKLVRTGIRRRLASQKYARTPKGQRARRRALSR